MSPLQVVGPGRPMRMNVMNAAGESKTLWMYLAEDGKVHTSETEPEGEGVRLVVHGDQVLGVLADVL